MVCRQKTAMKSCGISEVNKDGRCFHVIIAVALLGTGVALATLPFTIPNEVSLRSQSSPAILDVTIVDEKNQTVSNSMLSDDVVDYSKIGSRNIAMHFEATDNVQSVFLTLDHPKVAFCSTQRPFSFPKATSFPAGLRKVEAIAHSDDTCGNPMRVPIFTREFYVTGDISGIPTPQTPSAIRTSTEAPPVAPVVNFSEQPRLMTLQEAKRVAGALSLPEGSPWCTEDATFWTFGGSQETAPRCFNGNSWGKPSSESVVLPQQEDTRHDCGRIDANDDGMADLYCIGSGDPELYLTQPDGSLVEMSGLFTYPGMDGRHTTTVMGSNNDQLAFVATSGIPRSDGLPNHHAMFRVSQSPEYFEEVFGPWNVYSNASFVYTMDVNRDGRDDLIVGNEREFSFLFVQNADSSWDEVKWDSSLHQKNWRSMRIADFNGDGIKDALVTYFGHRPLVRIFAGIPNAPYFDFEGLPYYERELPFSAPDVEVLDANLDGILDFYVVQRDEKLTNSDGTPRLPLTYCAGEFNPSQWWQGGDREPPSSFIPPADQAPDALFLGQASSNDFMDRFEAIEMMHTEPGCGNLVQPFGRDKLILTHGTSIRPGPSVLLEWN